MDRNRERLDQTGNSRPDAGGDDPNIVPLHDDLFRATAWERETVLVKVLAVLALVDQTPRAPPAGGVDGRDDQLPDELWLGWCLEHESRPLVAWDHGITSVVQIALQQLEVSTAERNR